MNEILFIGDYPDSTNIKDGMIQRIKNIDDIFINYKRLYLSISFNKNFKYKEFEIGENVLYKKLNYFGHHKMIQKIFEKYKYIYVHSILNYVKIEKFLSKDNVVILDVHGVVPEEYNYNNKFVKHFISNKIEKEAFQRTNYQVFVTETMKEHFISKYGKVNGIIYPILPSNLKKEKSNGKEIKESLGINDDEVVFVYSGNTQKYQNIDLILETISKLQNEKYKFIILSKDIEIIKQKLYKYNLDKEQVIFNSVQPEELSKYYQIANYGFILRDEHILNNVACPTKLVEYMFYGIIPIVKSENIGDFKKLGYEYITYKDLNNNLPNVKSQKNSSIIIDMYKNNDKSKILNMIEDK